MAEIKTLEHSTLKVPYEQLNKKFRGAQKVIDREVARVQGSITKLEECLKNSAGISDITSILDTMVDGLSVMKRKAGESFQEEIEAAQQCKRRIEHLKEFDEKGDSGNLLWMKKRMERMLVEYFLHRGYYNAAATLARQAGIEDLTNVDLFLVVKEVEDSLLAHDTSRCLAWCYENRSKLRKAKSTLEFNLRQQEFIELVRNGQRLEAVRHARKYLVSLAEDVQMGELQHVMALLAFTPDTQLSPFKEMFEVSRWKMLADEFKEENFRLYQLNSTPTFIAAVQMGLSSLKTHQCYADHSKNAMCPVCSKHFNALAEGLAFSHCAQSRLVCRISGNPLNEHNTPMMLPNGYVYGLEALTQMAIANDGKVMCPRTKEVFSLAEAERVYVM